MRRTSTSKLNVPDERDFQRGDRGGGKCGVALRPELREPIMLHFEFRLVKVQVVKMISAHPISPTIDGGLSTRLELLFLINNIV